MAPISIAIMGLPWIAVVIMDSRSVAIVGACTVFTGLAFQCGPVWGAVMGGTESRPLPHKIGLAPEIVNAQ